MNRVIPERRKANRYLSQVKIIGGDIAEQAVDAIVTAIPQNLIYKGSLNTRLAQCAGEDLSVFIQNNIFEPRAGDVYAVPGFGLPCKHILISIIPVWRTEFDRQDKSLLNLCRNVMDEARNMGLKHIAFPPVACGVSGFPKNKGARLILQGIEDRLDSIYENEAFEEVRIVARTEKTCAIFRDRIQQMGG